MGQIFSLSHFHFSYFTRINYLLPPPMGRPPPSIDLAGALPRFSTLGAGALERCTAGAELRGAAISRAGAAFCLLLLSGAGLIVLDGAGAIFLAGAGAGFCLLSGAGLICLAGAGDTFL